MSSRCSSFRSEVKGPSWWPNSRGGPGESRRNGRRQAKSRLRRRKNLRIRTTAKFRVLLTRRGFSPFSERRSKSLHWYWNIEAWKREYNLQIILIKRFSLHFFCMHQTYVCTSSTKVRYLPFSSERKKEEKRLLDDVEVGMLLTIIGGVGNIRPLFSCLHPWSRPLPSLSPPCIHERV